ncbi:MAG TPA: BPSL0067 family protein [Acetobacteraceae bacterium]|jgi:hypothetical protein|nr:BPSL0067 family protein [Acetobacteraceae bacterium]
MFIASDPRQYLGKIVDSGQCVRFVQVATPGLPHTGYWRAGQKVRGGAVPAGAVIATFEPDGRYTNRVDGGSHAAVLIAENSDGLAVYDQWVGQPVHQRVIRYRGGSGNAANDGDRFHVVEVEA